MICVVNQIKQDAESLGTFHVDYETIDGSVHGVMMFQASNYEEAKNKFFNLTKGCWSGYNWPHNRL